MPAGLITPQPPSATPANPAARHLRALDRLVEVGVAIALDLQAQIHAFTPPPPDPAKPPPHPFDLHDALAPGRASADLALAFARVSRAVRLTAALHERLSKGEGAGPDAGCAQRVRLAPTPPTESSTEATETDTERACRERLFDRERPDIAPDGPVDEIIAQICVDLGLPPDWTDTLDTPAAPCAQPDPASAPAQPYAVAAPNTPTPHRLSG
jgi:hypothetical protein